jgi:hypothetical protein
MENTVWYNKKRWLILSILFSPAFLYIVWKNDYMKTWLRVILTAPIVLFMWAIFKNPDSLNNKKYNSQTTASTTQKVEPEKEIGLNDVLHTDYFEIIAKNVALQDEVKTTNQFADLKKENGNQYLIFEIEFKNIDNESRMLTAGSLFINYNGKEYEYDKVETIIAKGWEPLLEQVNPLTTSTKVLVYKIPKEIKGKIYWKPGRTDKRIYLGSID